jgi:hypothetical protein
MQLIMKKSCWLGVTRSTISLLDNVLGMSLKDTKVAPSLVIYLLVDWLAGTPVGPVDASFLFQGICIQSLEG